MFFSVITNNLNWEIATKNGVKGEKFQYYRGFLKNLIFRGGHEKPIYKYIGEGGT